MGLHYQSNRPRPPREEYNFYKQVMKEIEEFEKNHKDKLIIEYQ